MRAEVVRWVTLLLPLRSYYCFERAGLPPEKQLSDIPLFNETGLKFKSVGRINERTWQQWSDPNLVLPNHPDPPKEVCALDASSAFVHAIPSLTLL
jgi:hypothetical protein